MLHTVASLASKKGVMPWNVRTSIDRIGLVDRVTWVGNTRVFSEEDARRICEELDRVKAVNAGRQDRRSSAVVAVA